MKYGFQAGIINNYPNNIDCGGTIGQCDILTTKYNFPVKYYLILGIFLVELVLNVCNRTFNEGYGVWRHAFYKQS
jgi:hypothetical protein